MILALFGAGCIAEPPVQETVQPAANAPAAATATAPAQPAATAPKPATTTKPPLQPNNPPAKPGPATVVVTILDNAFSPQVIAINAGDTVVWTNKGKSNHTSTFDTSLLWDSSNIFPGKSYSRKFTAPGSYNYHCNVHAGMKGTVVVH